MCKSSFFFLLIDLLFIRSSLPLHRALGEREDGDSLNIKPVNPQHPALTVYTVSFEKSSLLVQWSLSDILTSPHFLFHIHFHMLLASFSLKFLSWDNYLFTCKFKKLPSILCFPESLKSQMKNFVQFFYCINWYDHMIFLLVDIVFRCWISFAYPE